jgi:hypothetical protein
MPEEHLLICCHSSEQVASGERVELQVGRNKLGCYVCVYSYPTTMSINIRRYEVNI